MTDITQRWNPRGRWAAPGLAVLAGAVAVTAFAPFGAFWVLPLSLAALFRLADGAGPRRAALIGLAYGIGQFTAGIYWIMIGLSVFGIPLVLGVAIVAGLIVLLSVFIGLTLALAGRIAPTPGAMRYLIWLPALWVLLEWLRSWIFSGFPWLALGYSQIDSPLAGIAPIFGVFGVSWAAALSAGLAAWLTARPRRAPIALVGALVIWAGAWGLGQIDWTHATGKPLAVTLVQGDIAQNTKWTLGSVEKAIDRYSRLTAGHWRSDLVIWPETAIPDYYREVKPWLAQRGRRLAAHDTTLITGLLRVNIKRRRFYNSAVAIGARHGYYNKRHLVPLAESFPVPLPMIVRRWMAESGLPATFFTPGALDQKPIVAAGVSLGITICYEDIFAALSARDVPPAQVLINISDDDWFGRSIGPEQHFQIARMRAVETGRYLLRADNSAVTGIVGPKGRVVKRAPGFEPRVITGRIRGYEGTTPFARWGNYGVVGLGLLVIAAAGLVRLLGRARRYDHGL